MTAFHRIIAVTVTYNSGPELRENILAILPQVDKVILVDNSTEAASVAWLKQLEKAYPIEVIYNNRNVGLGAAQNTGIRRAAVLGADWVLLLDDDSKPDAAMVATLKSALQSHPDPTRVGLLAARIIDVESGKRYPALKMHSRWKVSRVDMDKYTTMDEALLAMASGSLVRMQALKTTGLMREDFIIDFIDWEFCLRLAQAGWSIVQVRDAVLNHRLGKQTNHELLGRNFVTTNYPPYRRYTTAKNRILFWRLNFMKLPVGCFLYQCMSWGYETLVIAFFEQDKWLKIKAMLKGAWEGLTLRGLESTPPSL